MGSGNQQDIVKTFAQQEECALEKIIARRHFKNIEAGLK
jgi:hypothetical protein